MVSELIVAYRRGNKEGQRTKGELRWGDFPRNPSEPRIVKHGVVGRPATSGIFVVRGITGALIGFVDQEHGVDFCYFLFIIKSNSCFANSGPWIALMH